MMGDEHHERVFYELDLMLVEGLIGTAEDLFQLVRPRLRSCQLHELGSEIQCPILVSRLEDAEAVLRDSGIRKKLGARERRTPKQTECLFLY